MKAKALPGINALPPIFDGIPIIYEDDYFQTPAEIAAFEKVEAEHRAFKRENRALRKEVESLRKRLKLAQKRLSKTRTDALTSKQQGRAKVAQRRKGS